MPTFLLKTMVFIYIYIYQNHLRFALPYVELGTQLEFSPVGTPGGEFCGSSLGTFCTQLNAVSYREVQKRRVQRSGNIDTIEGINFLLRTKQLHFDQYLLQEAARQYLFFCVYNAPKDHLPYKEKIHAGVRPVKIPTEQVPPIGPPPSYLQAERETRIQELAEVRETVVQSLARLI